MKMILKDNNVPCCSGQYWVIMAISLVLVSLAGITSGLALGLLSIGQVDLEVIVKAGKPQESKYAAKIMPLVKNEHLLLCTLLVAKSLALEALPIFLDAIFPSWGAILVSVTFVLVFVEILPQAVCSRYGLQLGAKLALLVRVLLLILFPISYAFSKVLDYLLGKEHSALYRRAELKTLVDFHANEAGKGGELTHHETTIIGGALELTEKTARQAMTPISETFSLNINAKLDMETMELIMSRGHSRVPIYSGNQSNIIGLILVKNLIFCRPEDETPIKHMTIRRTPKVYEDWPLYEILNLFHKGHSHMAIVLAGKGALSDITPRWSLSKRIVSNSNTHHGSMSARPDIEEGWGDRLRQNKFAGSPRYAYPMYHSTDSDRMSYKQGVIEEKTGDFNARSQRWWIGSRSCEAISPKDIESIPRFSEEEVIGIITMEDVMEELLQKEILDETDEYVDLHNKIRIKLPSLRRSSSSLARGSASQFPWKSPGPSQSPSSNAPATMNAQASPRIQSPQTTPTFYTPPSSPPTSPH